MSNKKLSAIILDDEIHAIEQLRLLLNETGRVEVIKSITSPENAVCQILQHSPDVLFLDMQMPVLDGIDLLKALSQFENIPHVVAHTAFEDYMLQAFRNSAFDFLLKPVDRNDLDACIDRVKRGMNGKTKQNFRQLFNKLNHRITIPGSSTTHFIDPDDVLYIEADGRYTNIHLVCGKKINSCHNLGRLMDDIKMRHFLRISRSSVINTNYLTGQNHRNKTMILEANGTAKELSYTKRYFKLSV